MIRERNRKARNTHTCTDCRQDIAPGQRYVEVTVAPWTQVQDDPDGGSSPLGTWQVQRLHFPCFDRRFM
jgi:hypothetical protein